ncbi:1113_t:CDS:2, partial [Diversispora eburnea]
MFFNLVSFAITTFIAYSALKKFQQKKQQQQPNLKDFKKLSTLGTGAYGRVRLCSYNNNYYAMKVLKKSKIVKYGQVEHTITEKNLLRDFQNPFIVKLFWSFKDKYQLYMIQEFVMGGEIYTHLTNSRRFKVPVARFYAAEVLLALEFLHENGFIYRDLKPENVLLDINGHVKLIDFGFSKRIYNERTVTFCGTPEYLAPEIILKKEYGYAAEWWAYGIFIYEILIGNPPFRGDSSLETYNLILEGSLKLPSNFSRGTKTIIKKLLKVNETERLNNARDIKNEKFFNEIDWNKLYNKEIEAPIRPFVKDPGDTNANSNEFGQVLGKALNFTFEEHISFTKQMARKFFDLKTKGQTTVFIYNNINQLIDNYPKIIDALQDNSKDNADNIIYIVIFVSSEARLSSWSCVDEPVIKIGDLSREESMEYLVKKRKIKKE